MIDTTQARELLGNLKKASDALDLALDDTTTDQACEEFRWYHHAQAIVEKTMAANAPAMLDEIDSGRDALADFMTEIDRTDDDHKHDCTAALSRGARCRCGWPELFAKARAHIARFGGDQSRP